jgi:hypothetical protein
VFTSAAFLQQVNGVMRAKAVNPWRGCPDLVKQFWGLRVGLEMGGGLLGWPKNWSVP